MGNLNFNKLNSNDPKVKYGFTKQLLQIGKNNPETLFKYFKEIITMLKSGNNIIKWTGIDLIGYLSSVDKENKINKYISVLIKLLHGGNLITSNHAIFALGIIAMNKLKYKNKIIKEFISISKDKFETKECKNIATGKVLDALKLLRADYKDKNVAEFIKNAANNNRNATKQRAVKLLKKFREREG